MGEKKKIENKPGEVSTEEQAFLCVLTPPWDPGRELLSRTVRRSPAQLRGAQTR